MMNKHSYVQIPRNSVPVGWLPQIVFGIFLFAWSLLVQPATLNTMKEVLPVNSTDNSAKRGNDAIFTLRYFSSQAVSYRPIYVVTVFSDRRVLFEGQSPYVRTQGAASHDLSEEKYQAFLSELRSKSVEDIVSRSGILDGYASIQIRVGDVDRLINFSSVNASDYVKLSTRLEPYLQTMKYRCPVSKEMEQAIGRNICASIFELDTPPSQQSK